MIVITILSFAAAGILSYSLTTYRNSVRQAMLDQAKELSDSEMENLYFKWKTGILSKTPIPNVESTMPIGPASNASSLMGNAFPFLNTVSSSWSVYRFLHWDQVQNTSDGSATGIMPGTINEIGKNFYFTAETGATLTSPLFGTITYHSGRHFVYSSTSLFQFAVFYEGNLELAPGSDMKILGPVATNASAYLGTVSSVKLTLASTVYYFQEYEGAVDPLSGTTDSLTSSGLVDPIYNPNPDSAPPDQVAARARQVQQLKSQISFLGDVNVGADVLNPAYAAAYTNPVTQQVDPNEIYRAVIAPPPGVTTNGVFVADQEDSLVKASRMYNAAGVLITISQATTGGPIEVDVGGRQSDGTVNPTAYYNGAAGTGNSALVASINNGTATSVIQTPRTQIVDPREYLNGKSAVSLTTVDIGNLKTALTAAMAADPSGLGAAYNGVVYVYDKTDTSTVAPGTLNGIRITDAVTTPNFPDSNNNPLGFTIVSDNGVYVQGDYNTEQITVNGSQAPNPSAIMGDAVTALSQGWIQANNAAISTLLVRTATASTILADNVSPGHPLGMEIDAAILTGNTPTNTSVSPMIKSGGAQNLVRLMEDWYGPDLSLTVTGSMGQLFSSKYFQGAWPGTGTFTALNNNAVYLQPQAGRFFNYDLNFQKRTPAGSPTTTSFHKGNFFIW
jgi:hypothetical protein